MTDAHTATFVLKSSDASVNLPGFAEGTGASAAHIGTFAIDPAAENTSDAINTGTIGWTFTLGDDNAVLQSLAVGQTITQVYTVSIKDASNTTATQDVTVTIIGANDAPVLAADSSGLHSITELDGQTGSATFDSASGSLTFTDVDLIDTHTAGQDTPVFSWSGGTLTGDQKSALTSASLLTLNPVDSTNSGIGSIGFTYSAADSAFDFLAAGQTLTVSYNITVTDNHGESSTQPITFTITGTNDTPTPVNDVVAVNEDATASATTRATGVLANDTDPDTGDAAALVVSGILAARVE